MQKLGLLGVVVCFLGLGVNEARADGAVSFVLGAGLGGNLTALDNGNLDIETAFKNSPIYGLRVGSYGFPIGFEGSLLYTPSALVGGIFDDQIQATANILYTEANVLVILMPGPVAPFVTAGAGLHYLDFNIADFLKLNKAKLGWNWGGGVKVNVARMQLRFDVRDHISTFGLGDFGLGDLGTLFGLAQTDVRVHNVEASFGIGVRF